jgi:AraC-like DNA-binding protein
MNLVATASVARVAAECGFGDLSYLGRAVRRRFDCSASKWRQRADRSG